MREKPALKLLLVMLILSVMAVPANVFAQVVPGTFADLGHHWAKREIEMARALGFMVGKNSTSQSQTLFYPDKEVTRAELASALVRTFDLGYGTLRFIKQPEASDYFRDVDNKSWYAQDVVICAVNDIFDRAWDYRFYPDRPVTRRELAAIVYRCFALQGLELKTGDNVVNFTDTKGFYDDERLALNFVAANGIMTGKGDRFRPEDKVTRAELAVVLDNCLMASALTEADSGKEITVRAGDSLRIILPLKEGLGADLSYSVDENVLRPVEKGIFLPSCRATRQAGEEGMSYWRFKATYPGSTELSLRYPEDEKYPAVGFKVKVKVIDRDDGDAFAVAGTLDKCLSEKLDVDLMVPIIQGLNDKTVEDAVNYKFKKDATDFKDQIANELKSYLAEAPRNERPFYTYEAFSRYRVGFKSDKLLSLYVDYYQYTGGAHGITERRAYNIDVTNGRPLLLKDLFKPGYDYQEVINRAINEQIKREPEMYFKGDMGFKGIDDKANYYLEKDALVIYFQPYEIAPYAAGIPEFRIPFREFGDNIIPVLRINSPRA